MQTLLTTTGTTPSARNTHSTVVSNGKMVVFGGKDGYQGPSYNDAWTLDLTTLAWTLLTTTGTKLTRTYHSSIASNEKMVVFGGYDSSVFYNDAWTLDLSALVLLPNIDMCTVKKKDGDSGYIYEC